jgi:hypothetical protein
MRNLARKRTLVIAVVATLGVSAAAIAYWSASGSGTGSASVATSNGTLSLAASFANGLTPGDTKPVTFTASNTGSSSLRVGTVTSVVSIDSAHASAGCLAGDFTVAPVVQDQTIPANTSNVALATPGSIAFADTGVNQDGCKGATVTLTLSSN